MALVFPRAIYEEADGNLPGALTLSERVQEHWRMHGLIVVLDSASPDGVGRLHKAYLGAGQLDHGDAAVVTHEGRLEMKAWADTSDGFTLHSLAPIAVDAHQLSPSSGD